VEWAAAIGIFDGSLHCSVRTTGSEVHAGELLQRAVLSRAARGPCQRATASAGAHDMCAAGRIAVGADPAARERASAMVRDRLLAALGVDAASAQPLGERERRNLPRRGARA